MTIHERLILGAAVLGLVACGGSATGEAPASSSSSGSPEASSGGEHAAADAHTGEETARARPEFIANPLDPGASQSPINILSVRAVPGSHTTTLRYNTSHERVVNTGHSVQANYDEGSTVTFDGNVYDLVQFHFHTPSEHLIDGVRYPLEMHAVHVQRGYEDRYLVIAVLYRMGERNALVDALLDVLPEQEGMVEMDDRMIDVREHIPEDMGTFYHYDGSLTTPPYTETVNWLILERIAEASPEQITRLGQVMGHNARQVQPDRGRVIERCRDD